MSEIRKYILVDSHGNEDDCYRDDYRDAYEQARKRNCAVVAHVFTFDDSELIWTPNGDTTWPPNVNERLEYLRGEIRAERISYSELAELQGLAEHIDSGDVELLEWAGVPEK